MWATAARILTCGMFVGLAASAGLGLQNPAVVAAVRGDSLVMSQIATHALGESQSHRILSTDIRWD